jgi:hypothetical protein
MINFRMRGRHDNERDDDCGQPWNREFGLEAVKISSENLRFGKIFEKELVIMKDIECIVIVMKHLRCFLANLYKTDWIYI